MHLAQGVKLQAYKEFRVVSENRAKRKFKHIGGESMDFVVLRWRCSGNVCFRRQVNDKVKVIRFVDALYCLNS